MPAAKVLLVDDSTDLLEMYELLLNDRGYEARTAPSVDAAIAMIRSWRPDVVVTDIVMPEKSGLELITWMRSDLAPPIPPIVALSGFPDMKGEALRRGASAFHVKPLEASELLEALEAATEARNGEAVPTREELAVRRRRRAAAEAAEAAVAETLAGHPDFVERVRVSTRLLSNYFGHGTVAVLLLSRGHLRVLCSSHPERLPDGSTADQVLGRVVDVIASGSTLVIPDLGLARALGVSDVVGSGPLASAPLLSQEGAVIGNLAVFGELTDPFDAADLGIIEYVARHGATAFTHPGSRPLAFAPYLFREHTWRFFLQQELEHLRGRGIAIALMETLETLSSASAEWIGTEFSPRTALGALTERRLGVYSLADTVDAARRELMATVVALRDAVGLGSVGMVTCAGAEPLDSASTVIDLADATLRSAARRKRGTLMVAKLESEVRSV